MDTPKDKYYIELLDTLVKENNLRGEPLSNQNIQEPVSDVIEPEMRKLVNLTIRNHSYTNSWKYSRVLPGFKNKGSRAELKFYRPISNIQEISKLAERCVYNQMYDYLDKNDLIHPNHHGFLKNCSTSTALQQIYDVWMKHLDGGKWNIKNIS